MSLPNNYTECGDTACGGIYKNTESNTLGLCRRCREAAIARSLRMGIGEPTVEVDINRPNAGGRVVRKSIGGFNYDN